MKKNSAIRITHLLLVSFLLAAGQLFAQQQNYARVVEQYKKEHHFNGTVIIATNGKVDFIKSTGIANRSDSTLLTPVSKFKIASITKTFTAVIILQLMQETKLKLEDTIGKYLPAYQGEAKNKVSIYQLLTYSSGIPNCDGDSGIAVYQRRLPTNEFIEKNCSGNLHFAPGSQFEYNNADYILLGKIIENITGKSFAQNLQQRILQPLSMSNTGLLSDTDIVSHLVSSYTYNDSTKQFYNDEPYCISNFGAAGAMYSTAADMVKFDDGIFNHKLISPQTVTRMIQPDTSLQNVALGFWATNGYGDINTPFVYRPGGILGSSANWIHLLEEKTTFIIISNTDATSLFQMTGDLYRAGKAK